MTLDKLLTLPAMLACTQLKFLATAIELDFNLGNFETIENPNGVDWEKFIYDPSNVSKYDPSPALSEEEKKTSFVTIKAQIGMGEEVSTRTQELLQLEEEM